METAGTAGGSAALPDPMLVWMGWQRRVSVPAWDLNFLSLGPSQFSIAFRMSCPLAKIRKSKQSHLLPNFQGHSMLVNTSWFHQHGCLPANFSKRWDPPMQQVKQAFNPPLWTRVKAEVVVHCKYLRPPRRHGCAPAG